MKNFLVLIVLITLFYGCSIDNCCPSVKIRILNASEYNYCNIRVDTSTGLVSFEDINSTKKTNYLTFKKAYRYAFIGLEIDGETYIYQPIDYVGEEPLKNGYYTYEIDIDKSQGQYRGISLKLIQD